MMTFIQLGSWDLYNLLLFLPPSLSWQRDDTPFSPGQISSCNYVNHWGFVDWEFKLVRGLERGIMGTAAVQGTVSASFLSMRVSVGVCVCRYKVWHPLFSQYMHLSNTHFHTSRTAWGSYVCKCPSGHCQVVDIAEEKELGGNRQVFENK